MKTQAQIGLQLIQTVISQRLPNNNLKKKWNMMTFIYINPNVKN